jgi:copper chaperone CopZ
MDRLIVDVPAMYGDHHVLRIRQILLDIPGVGDVTASAARRQVAVSFDEAATSTGSILDALRTAGYGPEDAPPYPQFPKRHEDGSAWYVVLGRTTVTERKDREMAGDFRRY